MAKKLEIELRARIDSQILENLISKHTIVSESIQHDIYYKFLSRPENSWIVRIRKENEIYYLTYKSKNYKKDIAWSEVDIQIDPDTAKSLHDFFLQNGYFIDVEIMKSRKSIKDGDFNVNIDDIKGLGQFIEIELFADSSKIHSTQAKIKKYLKKIGVSPKNIIDKGYVALMKGRFNHE